MTPKRPVTARPEDRAPAPVPSAAAAPPSIISADLKIVGNLIGRGDLQVDGTVEGDISSQRLIIGEGAIVHGGLVGESVRVYGTVSGEIEADEVVLTKTARVEGDITQRTIAMEAGAAFLGRLSRREKTAEARRSAADRTGPQTSEDVGAGTRGRGPYGT